MRHHSVSCDDQIQVFSMKKWVGRGERRERRKVGFEGEAVMEHLCADGCAGRITTKHHLARHDPVAVSAPLASPCDDSIHHALADAARIAWHRKGRDRGRRPHEKEFPQQDMFFCAQCKNAPSKYAESKASSAEVGCWDAMDTPPPLKPNLCLDVLDMDVEVITAVLEEAAFDAYADWWAGTDEAENPSMPDTAETDTAAARRTACNFIFRKTRAKYEEFRKMMEENSCAICRS